MEKKFTKYRFMLQSLFSAYFNICFENTGVLEEEENKKSHVTYSKILGNGHEA
jgi:hypothetical protein